MLPMSVARSSSGMLTIGRIAYRREGGDGSAQGGRSVIYDCLVFNLCPVLFSAADYSRTVITPEKNGKAPPLVVYNLVEMGNR